MIDAVRAALEYISTRKRAYQLTYQLHQPANVVVLEDLAKFCRANETCVVPGNHDMSLILEGRREVWLRINQHLHLTAEQLVQLYSGNGAVYKPQGDVK